MLPGVSVIVPVYNGEGTLPTCLNAITMQDYDGPLDVIVVDNGSTDRSRECARNRKHVRLLTCRRPGAGPARNDGIDAARYDLVAFTDADCIPDRSWLSQLVRALSADLVGVGGPLVSCSQESIAEYVATISFKQEAFVEYRLPYLATSNALYRRPALIEVGKFDETFDIAGGEDNDLGWRLAEKGYRLGYAEQAVCKHNHPNSLADFIIQRIRYGYGESLLLRKHHELLFIEDVISYAVSPAGWRQLCTSVIDSLAAYVKQRQVQDALAIISEAAFFCGHIIGRIHHQTTSDNSTEQQRMVDLSGKDDPMCIRPWTSFEIDDQFGSVVPCCWTPRKLGNVHDQSIAEIWNGPGYQEFRHLMLESQYDEICPADCPVRVGASTELLPVDGNSKPFRINMERLRDTLAERRTVVQSQPIIVRLLPSIQCNLQCIMCWQREQEDQHLPAHFYTQLKLILPQLHTLILQGGEPLLIDRCHEIMVHCTTNRYPDLQIGIITNGILLTKTFLKTIERTAVNWLFVSLDAATPETYKRIRGAAFDSVCQNVQQLLMSRPDISTILGFVVMQENVHEMLDFIQMAERFGTEFEFSPLRPGFQKDDDFLDAEFRRLLAKELKLATKHIRARGLRNRSLNMVDYHLWVEQFRSCHDCRLEG